MKTKIAVITICCLLSAICFSSHAQGTAFTYQGQLQNNGGPANGSYDFKLILYDAATAGNVLAGPVTNTAVAVSNGLFTMTVDFGPGVFIGESNWLHLAVSTNGAGNFVVLSPRQQLTPVPYSIFAENVSATGISGPIPASNLSGTYGGTVNFNNGADSFDGSFYGDFYGATFTGGNFVGNFVGTGSDLTDVWHTGGNFGTTAGTDFVGTIDNQPLEFHVNNQRALRLEPTADTANVSGAVNVIAGSSANFAAPGVQGATIAGGGAPYYFGGGTSNRVASSFDTVGGGVNNDIETNSYEATIGGGNANSILPGGYRSTIGGGWDNTIETDAFQSVIGGGILNTIQSNAYNSVVSGGQANVIAIPWAVIAGGYYNTNAGGVAFIGAGDFNNIQAAWYAVIGGGFANAIQTNDYESVIGGGMFNAIQTAAPHSVIGGGGYNQIAGDSRGLGYSVVAGGYHNAILTNADYSVIGGGLDNQIYGDTNDFGTGVIAGGDANVINSNSWNSFIGGGQQNSIGAGSDHGVISGGQFNSVQSSCANATIGGGAGNTIQPFTTDATIGGGVDNAIQTNNPGSTIGGGYFNQIQSSFYVNAVAANTIAGGMDNVIQSNVLYAAVGGGLENSNDAYLGTIPGGYDNYAAGIYSFAAGNRAQALYAGDFVWADDSQNTNFASTAPNQVSFRCAGGVVFTSGSGGGAQTVAWTPGSASWSFSSDRNLKDDFQKINPESILAKVARLPIVEWSYKGYSQRHIGAMAQDFHALFPLNHNDKTLNDADLHGVELAAIQGLNQKVDSENAALQIENAELKRQNETLEKRLEHLEQMVQSLSDKN